MMTSLFANSFYLPFNGLFSLKLRTFFQNEFLVFTSEFYLFFLILFFLFVFVILGDSQLYLKPKILSFSLKISSFGLILLFFLLYNNLELFYVWKSFSYNFLFDQNGFTFLIKIILIFISLFCLFFSHNFLKKENIDNYEFSLLFLLSLLGMFVLVSSNDFLSFYLAIELQSLSFYILAALKKESTFSTEAGLKYFILGAIGSSFLLLGMCFIYQVSGLTVFTELRTFVITLYSFENFIFIDILFGHLDNMLDFNFFVQSNQMQSIIRFFSFFLFGLFLLLSGIFFKLGVFPFHSWVPDVYEGVPTNITAIFAILPKIAIFTIFLKIYYQFYDYVCDLLLGGKSFLLVLFFFTIVIGSLGAIYQTKIKRLLAYSAISHVGFLGIASILGTMSGLFSFFFYILVYILLNLSFFGMYISMRYIHNNLELKKISDLQNLAELYPGLSFCLAINLFSIAGVPPLLGFFSKFYIFVSLFENRFYLFGIFTILISVLSSFYYIRLIKTMYFSKFEKNYSLLPFSKADSLIFSFFCFFNIFFICYPEFLQEFAESLSHLFDRLITRMPSLNAYTGHLLTDFENQDLRLMTLENPACYSYSFNQESQVLGELNAVRTKIPNGMLQYLEHLYAWKVDDTYLFALGQLYQVTKFPLDFYPDSYVSFLYEFLCK